MKEKGCKVSRHDVVNLMKFFKYKRRSLSKTKVYAQTEGRNEQFEKIASLKKEFIENGFPVFSLDTKKKELLGNFYRPGTYYGTKPQEVYDHDFISYAEGKVVPHGIYDVADNRGYLTLGLNKDTSKFVCDNFEFFWEKTLQWKYAGKEFITTLKCDYHSLRYW